MDGHSSAARSKRHPKTVSANARLRQSRADGTCSRGPRQATNVKQLNLSERIYRKRVGDYRILFTIDDDAREIFVHGVPHRSDAH